MKGLIDKYMKYLRIERNASVHTLTSYENDLKQFHTYLSGDQEKEIDIESIDRLTIRLWLGELSQQGFSKSTIRRKVSTLRSFFKYAFRRGLIQRNPAHMLVVPRQDRPLPNTVHPEELNRMMELPDVNSPQGRQNRAILEVFYGAGIRLSELVQLNKDDVNFKQKQLLIMGKGAKQRIVPLGRQALEALERHFETRAQLYGSRTDDDARRAVFLAAKGQRIYPRAVQRLVEDYLKRTSEVTQKSPHVLRHSFATHLMDNGADIRVIKEFLGHANLAATQVYTHTSVERLRNIYETAHPRSGN